MYAIFLTITTCMVISSYASNILAIFPYSGYSHFRVFYPIVSGLADVGHNITVVSYYEPDENHPNYYNILLDGEKVWNNLNVDEFNPTRSMIVMFREFFELRDEGAFDCYNFYNSKALEEIINKHNQYPFDLLLMEVFNSDCVLGIAELMDLPVVGISSCALMPWHYDRIGLPDFPSFIPSEFVEYSQTMTFSERLVNFLVTKTVKKLYRLVELTDNQIIKQTLNIDIDVRDVAIERTRLILVNQHFTLSGSRIFTNKIVEIGGVHIDENSKELPKDLEEFIKSSKNGIIFINWGSNLRTSSIDKQKLEEIVGALTKLEQNVVWKWENNSTSVDDEKFFFGSWFFQKSLLCHPNVRAFWSHGGLLGISETCYCGVPVLVTPIYGDQFLNGRALEEKGVGKILLYNDITEESVYNSFQNILEDEYKVRARKLSWLYKFREKSPLKTALWWIEYVLKTNGTDPLQSPSVYLNWFVYYSVDVILFIFVGVVSLASIITCLLKLRLSGNKTNRQNRQRKSTKKHL